MKKVICFISLCFICAVSASAQKGAKLMTTHDISSVGNRIFAYTGYQTNSSAADPYFMVGYASAKKTVGWTTFGVLSPYAGTGTIGGGVTFAPVFENKSGAKSILMHLTTGVGVDMYARPTAAGKEKSSRVAIDPAFVSTFYLSTIGADKNFSMEGYFKKSASGTTGWFQGNAEISKSFAVTVYYSNFFGPMVGPTVVLKECMISATVGPNGYRLGLNFNNFH